MSSDSSDSDYETRTYANNSDSDSELNRAKREENTKGPQTPKSCSPQSQNSNNRLHELEFQDDSREIASPLSDCQEQNIDQDQPLGPRSPSPIPATNADDDGRSDISSGSSLLSQPYNKDEDILNLEAGDGSPLVSNSKKSPLGNNFPVSNADDLSDVSDLDDSDGMEEKDIRDNLEIEKEEKNCPVEESEDLTEQKTLKEAKDKESKEKAEKERLERENKSSLNMDDGEQLDFEAEDQPEVEKEDGEIEMLDKNKDKESKDDDKSADEGEVKEDEESLEDGEVTDEGDPKPEKPPVCRFYNRNCCTWGINCRFLHPGVTDKGNYTMFDVGRPLVAPPNGPALYPPDRPGYGHPVILPPARVLPGPYGLVPLRREENALVESAWERGLRQAKEMMRKSTKRKETDMDFEEKKMNLSIGQDEIDKENDYYTRAASPVDDPEAWVRLSSKIEPELRRPVRVVERYEDIIPEPASPAYYDKYDYRRGYERIREPEYIRREKKKYYEEEEYPVTKKSRREKMVREVIVQKVEKSRERHHADDGTRRRGDEWSDPWMRSKSPSRKGHRPRKTSYSSGSSSFSSRSGSRSSSNSSYTSYSRSRSRSLSNSHSPISRSRRPRTPSFTGKMRGKKISPSKDAKFRPLKAGTPIEAHSEKKLTVERAMLMNPPAPTPKRTKERPLSPTVMRKVGLNPPPPTPKASSRNVSKHSNNSKPGKVRLKKSRSSSGSGSSGSSSESSHSSYSSSSSTSRGGTPPVRPGKPTKKIEPNERLAAQTLKGKAMDALKVSGQKPQIKLTLKPPETKREKPALGMVAGKKRPFDDAPSMEPKVAIPVKPPVAKKTTSRREELLKQLKAVEDAIARKRSKI